MSEKKYDFDFFCIGGGSGGVRASRIAAKHGASVALCEEYKLGGTCVIRGCIPKKILWYASSFHTYFQNGTNYGWESIDVKPINWGKLIENKDNEVARLNTIYHKLLNDAGVKFIDGHGKLIDEHTIQVGDKKYTADKILICTGSWPSLPKIPGIELVMTSNEALDLKTLPTNILIVGGGYIACEFASIFSGVGVKVTLIYRGDKVLRGFDNDVRDTVMENAARNGIRILTNLNVSEIKKSENGFIVSFDKKEKESEKFDQILYATGRTPNLKNLGIENTKVKLNSEGAIEVNENSKTSVDNIYAVGDVTNRLNLTPVALGEGHAVADTLFGGILRVFDHRNVPTAVFTNPPVGVCGFTEEDAKKKLGDSEVVVFYTKFTPLMHTISKNGEKTMMKIIVEKKTDKVIGVHIVGDHAEDMIQLAGVAMQCGATKKQFDATVGVHPTSSEELVTMRTPRI